ncbi:MAG: DUF4145 domain-containing protein [bacterium]|nr:DUF4145 domain-containing protein [bacterium]MDZ4260625.1 DUF4145 domain-containing protein [Candidatus Sungbacteria bacterium]
MDKEQYYPPQHVKGEFHCPHCGVYAKQRWSHLSATGDLYIERNQYGVTRRSNISGLTIMLHTNLPESWTISVCEHCERMMVWDGENIIYPKKILVDQPNKDLAEDIKEDYWEAAGVLADSPRSAAAILRLALQKMCKQLGEKGENINKDIGELVKKGLNPTIQKSLDALRIAGNNAVHPGELDLSEDNERVIKLFKLLNFIAEKMITEPKEISSFYDDFSDGAKEAVVRRDEKNI